MKKLFTGVVVMIAMSAAAQTSSDAKMKIFIEALMKKMTIEEKIGQLNLPGSGDIVTGQASNSDIGKKIKEGKLKGCQPLHRVF